MENKAERDGKIQNQLFDNTSIKIIIFACVIIIIAVITTGLASFYVSKNEVMKKLKSKDLNYIVQAISTKVDKRLSRAVETSVILSQDPTIKEWILSHEKDNLLGDLAKRKIANIAQGYDYNNAFIVSVLTGNYWSEDGELLDVMNFEDSDDSWFFTALDENKAVDLDIDYNKERDNTYVFVNAMMRDEEKPIAILGVGLDLDNIAKEFAQYKFGPESSLWLLDDEGFIRIAEDEEHRGSKIEELLSQDAATNVYKTLDQGLKQTNISEYVDQNGLVYDLVLKPLEAVNYLIVLLIPRSETLAILTTLKYNFLLTIIITLLSIVLIFYFFSNKIANPYKRALLLNEKLENLVIEKTADLQEKNREILDSITYAKKIQESILPRQSELDENFKENFVIWKPRDIVGGDFYWFKKVGDGYLLILGDCTGHGVPGALMTMTVNSILNHIIMNICNNQPATIIKELDILLKETLNKDLKENMVDDGLDIGICYINGDKLHFAGAGIPLYIKDSQGIHVVSGSRKGIGYRSTRLENDLWAEIIDLAEEHVFYMTTDGYIDQNGGDKNYSFGKTRFKEILMNIGDLPLDEQKQLIIKELDEYKQLEAQRDDITIVGFKI